MRTAIQETDAAVGKHVLVGASGEDRDEAMSGCAPVPAEEGDQAAQFGRRRRETGRRQRVSRREVCGSCRTDARVGRGIFGEGGRQQAAVGVNVTAVHSGVVGKRVERYESADLSSSRTGWQMLPPRDRVGKRSDVDRVAGLSNNAKRWVGMAHKGRKRAAAPVNSQKKKMKKSYVDCWDFLDVADSSIMVGDGKRSASAAERDRAFLEESSFPSNNV